MDKRGLCKRYLDTWAIEELTSRKSATDIPKILDQLERPFAEKPGKDGNGKGERRGGKRPYDVLLATNMISVGVDVSRLGLMVVTGQPKTTAEYIQATSRVGRAYPGLVLTVYNWSRPRDLSHYERFEHYHATFYQYVEALSVTPFSSGAVERGLAALLVSEIRQRGTRFNANERAGQLVRDNAFVSDSLDTITARAGAVSGKTAVADNLRSILNERLDRWLHIASQTVRAGSRLVYRKTGGENTGLLRLPKPGGWDEFTCLNSLRDVEPGVSLILDDYGLDE